MHGVRLDVSCAKQHACSKVTAKANTLLYYFFVDLDITAVQFGSISQKMKSKTTMVYQKKRYYNVFALMPVF